MSSHFENEYTVTSRIIYTPSPFARVNLLSLQETGHLKALKSHMSRRTKLVSYLFFIVTNGEGNVIYNGKKVSLQKGDCFFIDCRKPYSQCSSVENPWSLSWVHFTGATVAAIYEKYSGRNGKPFFTAKDSLIYISLLNGLFDIASGNSYIRDMQINTKLSELLEHVMAETIVADHERTSDIALKRTDIQNVKQFIEENYTDSISLDDIADLHYINKNYLSKVFKEQYGLTVNGYIMLLRVNKAKGCLRFSNMTVEQISQECGFLDSNYFSRMFKKIEGISPTGYRENWLTKN
ncbi:AraC family transcriptional regulator [Bacteroides sp.]|uniref:AraC family transcriptional regulator n=1 Tax=Bacteroides sp. TaxID=29523 RepID=UPI00260A9F20|nr:AraC family transcriptional regulator [Bacteroides sp.]MDD3040968.1 AraC family transcriptional regulator [Bacteroides sp.]